MNYNNLPVFITKDLPSSGYEVSIEQFDGNLSNRYGAFDNNRLLIRAKPTNSQAQNKNIKIRVPNWIGDIAYSGDKTPTGTCYVNGNTISISWENNKDSESLYVNHNGYLGGMYSWLDIANGKDRWACVDQNNGTTKYIYYAATYWVIQWVSGAHTLSSSTFTTSNRNPIGLYTVPYTNPSYGLIVNTTIPTINYGGTNVSKIATAINISAANQYVEAFSLKSFTGAPSDDFGNGSLTNNVNWYTLNNLNAQNPYCYIPAASVVVNYSTDETVRRFNNADIDQDNQFYHSSPVVAKISFSTFVNTNLDSIHHILDATGKDPYILKLGNSIFSGCYLTNYNFNVQPFKPVSLAADFICTSPPSEALLAGDPDQFIINGDLIESSKNRINTSVTNNLFNYSNNFSNYLGGDLFSFNWAGVTATPNTSLTIDPTGGSTATSLVYNNDTWQRNRGINSTKFNTSTFYSLKRNFCNLSSYKFNTTLSIYAKKQSDNFFYLLLNAYNFTDYKQYWPYETEYVIFNLSGGSVYQSNSPENYYSLHPIINDVGNGWYRLSVSMQGGDRGYIGCAFGSLSGDNVPSYTRREIANRPYDDSLMNYDYFYRNSPNKKSYKNADFIDYYLQDNAFITEVTQNGRTGCHIFGAQLEFSDDGVYTPRPYQSTNGALYLGSGFNIDGTGNLSFLNGMVYGEQTTLENFDFTNVGNMTYQIGCNRVPNYSIGSPNISSMFLNTVEKQLDITSVDDIMPIKFSGNKLLQDQNIYLKDYEGSSLPVINMRSGSFTFTANTSVQQGDVAISQVSIKEAIF
jgi:hypothetical protein